MIELMQKSLQSTIWRYYAFVFLWHLHFFSAVLIPFFTDWGGISQVQIQLLQSWFMFWIFVLEVPTGAVADYLGRKYSLAIGAIVVTFGALIYGSVPRFEAFLLGEFLFAACFALISGADKALLYDALKEVGKEAESKKIFGRAHSVGLVSMLVAAPVGSLIASRLDLNYPMLLFAAPAFLACLVALSIKEPEYRSKQSESKRYLDIVKKGFTFFYRHKLLRALAVDAVIVAAGAYFVLWLYQPLLKMVGVPIAYFGFIHAAMVLTEVLISSNFVRIEKFIGGAKSYLKFSALLTGLSFILAGFYPNFITVAIFIIIGGGFGLTRLELIQAHMNKLIPSEQRATVLSSISMFRRFFLVLLNPAIGFTVDFSLGIALLVISILPLSMFFFSPIRKEVLE